MLIRRVEFWRAPYGDTEIRTQVEVQGVNVRDEQQPHLCFEHTGDSSVYVPTRLVLNFATEIRDYAPGDVITLTIEKSTPTDDDVDRTDLPF